MRPAVTAPVTIREYRPGDLESVLALVRELGAELADRFKAVKVKSAVEDYRRRYLNPGHKYTAFVAAVEDNMVGFAVGCPSLGSPEIDAMFEVLPLPSGEHPPEYYIQIVFVSRPFRKRGISTRLHERLIALARENGFKEIYACIAKWNAPELAVARSLKFEAKDQRSRYRLTLKL